MAAMFNFELKELIETDLDLNLRLLTLRQRK